MAGRAHEMRRLYVEQIDIGESQPRQVISGLVEHYKQDDLKDREVWHRDGTRMA